MDPITAVSLAGTVVQLLDFGIKLVDKAQQIYHSAEGAQVRNLELEEITENLVSINQRIQKRSEKVFEFSVLEDEKALESLTTRCNEIGGELIAALQNAKVQGSHRQWKSVRQALKSVMGSDRIQELYDRLKEYREQIVIVLLVITSNRQKELDKKADDIKDTVAEAESKIIVATQQSRLQILDAIGRSNFSPNKPQDVTTVSELLSDMVTRTSDKKNKEAVLNSLFYPRMQDRREWITEAHKKTFNWALTGNEDRDVPWSDLKEWLISGSGIYWLSGKAGSGKSTLMKYINQDPRTTEYLQVWASGNPLVFASFYFWNSGTSLQKSQQGLLQSLLHEILAKRSDLIPIALPARWQSSNSLGQVKFEWTITELTNAFNLLADTELETSFCFLIDGLDEFDGDHQNLIQMLIRMTRRSNIKILASSRPWLVFQDAFENHPKLTLQDLTHDDIRTFAHDSLYNHPRFSKMLSLEPERAPKLIAEIGNRAAGVFLWVYLVVRSLMEGLTNADRISDLHRRLEQLPIDLEQYFLHILTSLDSFYLYQASQLFRLALEARQPLSLLTFSYLDEEDPDYALKAEITPMSEDGEAGRCEVIERRLNSRCKGLLESYRRSVCDGYSYSDGIVTEKLSYEVGFLHRTVRDFLSTPTVQVKLVAPDTLDWSANMTLARAFVAQIKSLRKLPDSETNFQVLWGLVFDALYYISCIGDAAPLEAQVAILDELDRAAAVFRADGITMRRCSNDAHWINTGYRFGLKTNWNNDLFTVCVQNNMLFYVKAKLSSTARIHHTGKPLLAFAFLGFSTDRDELTEILNHRWGFSYILPKIEMVKLLLEKGASPNDFDESGGASIWVTFLKSMYQKATKETETFNGKKSDWLSLTKLMALHEASASVRCHNGKLPMELIHVVFDSDEVTELEDLLQLPSTVPPVLQEPIHKVPQITTQTQGDENETIPIIIQAPITSVAPPPVANLQPPRKHSRLSSWFREKLRS